MSLGHDEYWSGNEFNNVMAARNAGVNLAFFSGNEAFWKTYYSNSIDGSNTPYRTLVCYKETHLNNGAGDRPARSIPLIQCRPRTGTWADPRFSPPADGGIGQNELTGTFFDGQPRARSHRHPHHRALDRRQSSLLRNTAIAKLAQSVDDIGGQVLGYEWDSDVDNGFRPAGRDRHVVHHAERIAMQLMYDYGNTFDSEAATARRLTA